MEALSRNHRHLLLFAPASTNPELVLARQEIDRHRAGVDDRDLVVHEFVADERGEAYRRYGVDPARFCMILVGKDGGEKRRDERAVPLEHIFGLIDSMPMRRREMRERS